MKKTVTHLLLMVLLCSMAFGIVHRDDQVFEGKTIFRGAVSFPAGTQTGNMVLSDTGSITLGTDLDFSIKSNVAKTLNILPLAGDETYIVNIGADTAGADFKLFGATTGKYCMWDASADTLFVTGLFTSVGNISLNNDAGTATTAIGTGTTTGAITLGGGSNTVAVNSSDWDISATGDMTGIGAITADGLFTGTLGATVSGAETSINASSNFATNINTGTSTGAVTIGGGSGTVAIASTGIDISTAGAISNATTIGCQSVTASVGVQSTATAVTVTADWTGTGLIPAGASVVVITSDSADKQATLPANVVGTKMTIIVGATGCELICADASAKINDVVCGETNEAALAADTHYELTCISATEWIMVGITKLGAVDTPVVPDARS
jgi:hypothetical protein